MPATQRLQFSTTIAAPVETVFAQMIGADSYPQWTAAFAEGSTFRGSWQQGQKICFLSPSGHGVVAEIAEHRPNQFISIRHIGLVAGGVEDTHSDAVLAWAPAYENYSFLPAPEGTTLVVDQDTTAAYEATLVQAWPQALKRLKTLCESASVINFLIHFEDVALKEDFSLLRDMIDEQAYFRFNDGDFIGHAAIEAVFDKTWRGDPTVRKARFYLSDIVVLTTDSHSATATYTYHWEGSQGDQSFQIQGRGTRVLVRQGGRFKIIHEHLSRFPAAPRPVAPAQTAQPGGDSLR